MLVLLGTPRETKTGTAGVAATAIPACVHELEKYKNPIDQVNPIWEGLRMSNTPAKPSTFLGTPRTNAKTKHHSNHPLTGTEWMYVVPSDFARELERELNEALKCEKIPDVLFDGNKVFQHLRDNPECARSISAIHVCFVLDAVVAIMRKEKGETMSAIAQERAKA